MEINHRNACSFSNPHGRLVVLTSAQITALCEPQLPRSLDVSTPPRKGYLARYLFFPIGKAAKLKRPPYQHELGLFRFVQECLNNVRRHSQSPTAVISVFRNETCIKVEVQDHGRGFSSNLDLAFEHGLGLRMQERLRFLGGTLRVESNAEGTRVIATVPIGSLNFNLESDGRHARAAVS